MSYIIGYVIVSLLTPTPHVYLFKHHVKTPSPYMIQLRAQTLH